MGLLDVRGGNVVRCDVRVDDWHGSVGISWVVLCVEVLEC